MNQNPRDIYLQILNIIGYTNNKEEFTTKFFQICKQQAMINLIKTLPRDKQTILQTELAKQTTQDPNNLLLRKYFTQEQIASNLEETTKAAFQNYLQSIIPTLNNKQKTDLQIYLKNLSEKQP